MKLIEDTMTPALEKLIVNMAGRPMNRRISSIVHRDTRDHFHKQMGPYGPWPPLSQATINRRRNRSDTPLQDTRQLYQSQHPGYDERYAWVAWSKWDNENRQDVARLQNDGGITYIIEGDGRRIKIRVPARTFAWLSDIARREIESLPVVVVSEL